MKELITNEAPKLRLPDTVCNGKGEQTPWEEYLEIIGQEPQLQEGDPAKETGSIVIGEDTLSALLTVAKFSAQTLPDTMALQARALYDDWEDVIGQTVDKGFKFRYGGKLYKTIQPEMTIQEQNVPGAGTESLYTEINETNKGTKDDPIPYDNNMELESGKYYSQNGVVYLCTRDTGQPVFHDLSALVGLYVQVA